MSRAGKFIPGGSGSKTTGLGNAKTPRTVPIRAPEPGAPASEGKRPFGKGSSLIKPVSKAQRLPIIIMSGVVCCLLVSFAWYQFAVVPVKNEIEAARRQEAAAQKQLADALAAQKQQQEDLLKRQATARATLTVDSRPRGAAVTVGDSHKQTPASFNDLMPGTVTVLIHADGYADYKHDVAVTADKPVDLGMIQLVQQTGDLSLSSPQSEVAYRLTGPGDYAHEGQVPAKLEKLPMGDYQLTAWQHDWKLPPVAITIHDQESQQKEIKFPYATVSISSAPPGATVRNGHIVLGQTPLSLAQLRPGDLHLSVDLAPYTVQRFDLHVPEFGNITKQITLQQDKGFLAACNMAMAWIPDGGFWAGKYEVRQSEFETVASYNPSTFHRASRPVETVSWEAAMAFCDKLNQFERKAGKLPQGYHYALPTESQWDTLNADADINEAAMSRSTSLSSTQDVGASEPNKYGLYDTLGNVWEWCLDEFDDKGDHSLRGGSWLSSAENFPGPETRNAGGPKYADRFTGFRVVLVPN